MNDDRDSADESHSAERAPTRAVPVGSDALGAQGYGPGTDRRAPAGGAPADSGSDGARLEPPDATRPEVPGVRRRDYLKAVGGAGVGASLASVAAESAAAQSGWEAAADERIQEHRTGPLTVEVVDESGEPVSGAAVDVEMQSHDYWFGNVLSATLLDQTEPGHPYRESLTDDANVVWFGNHHKWRMFEEEQELADEATAWATDNGLDIRGHVCLWADVSSWPIPGDVVDAMGLDHQSGASGPDLDPQHVRDRTFEHVQTIIEHYADFEYEGTSYGSVIEEWEVVNEVVHEPGMIRAVDGVPADQEAPDLDPVTAPVLGEWYRHARDVAPDDVGLAANDYNTMEGSYEYARSDYERQIGYLVENGNLDYAGIQSHFGAEDTTVTPQEALDVLDRYAQEGVRLRVTEYDATGDDWSDEAKGEFFHDYLKTVFSHEATDAFLVAGGSDEHHWRSDAPFFYEGWEPKPAHEVYRDLVFDQWWTSEPATTGDDGTATVDAFLGEHEVTVSTDADSRTVTTEVTDADGGKRLVVSVEGGEDGSEEPDACADAAGGSADVDGQTVCDVDGDGLYRDLDGNGEVSHADVQAFFSVQHRPTWKQPDRFDFNENEVVGHGDVVALFEHVAAGSL